MCKVLMEHKSRQDLFYSCYEAMWRNSSAVMSKSVNTTSSQLKQLLDRLQGAINDRNPWTVLTKVLLCKLRISRDESQPLTRNATPEKN